MPTSARSSAAADGPAPVAPAPAGAGPDGTQAGWALVVDAIGPKVRALRRERGLTLQQLAHAADVSAASVHKVERGDMVPTVTTLLKIAGALEVPIRHFVEESDAGPLAVRSRWRGTGAADAVTVTGPAERFRSTGTVLRLAPGAEHRPARRAGECLLVVLDGRVTVSVADESYDLEAGEALHFPTRHDHRWANPGPAVAETMTVTVPEP